MIDRVTELERQLTAAKKLESKELLTLAKLVSDMRRAQMESARAGRWTVREAVKRHEEKVDEALKSIFGGQKKLFT